MFAHADLMQIQWHSFKNLSRIILKRVFMLNEIICLRDKKRTVAKLCMYLYIITMVKISFLDCQNEFNILLCAPPFVSQIIICIELELPYDDCVNIWFTCYLDTTNYREHIYSFKWRSICVDPNKVQNILVPIYIVWNECALEK